MDTSILQGLGFTKAEISVYLALLEIGPCTAGPIIEKSGLQSSVVHNALHTLKNKGLTSYVIKGKIKHYQGADPDIILGIIEDKKRKFKDILPELELKKKLAKEKLEATIYNGNKAAMAMLTDIIKNAKKGEHYLFFEASREGFDDEIQKFFEKYDAKRKSKGIIVRGLVRKDNRKLFEYREKKDYMKVRYVDRALPKGISVFRDNFMISIWAGEMTTFVIKSQFLADSYRELFDEIWNNAK